MAEEKVYRVPNNHNRAFIDTNKYQEMYTRSINKSNIFWEEQAEKFLTWFSKWDSVQQWDYDNLDIKWFPNAKLNVSYNCLDRHLKEPVSYTHLTLPTILRV